jgi:Spy/CpxP family protein refolding chaperone
MNIRWNQVAVAVAVGFILGAVFSDFYRMRRMPWPPPHDMGGPVEMFSRELKLTESQREKVSAIFEKYRPEMEKAMDENRPKIEEVRIRIKSELKTVLTPGQAARLEELEKDFGPNRPRHTNWDHPPMRRGPGGF